MRRLYTALLLFCTFPVVAYAITLGGGINVSSPPVDQSAIEITGGTIDGATIGGTTPAAGDFTDIQIIDGTPTLIINDSDAGADLKRWQVDNDDGFGTFQIKTMEDAATTGEVAYEISRTTTAVGTHHFDNGIVDIDETLNVDTSITSPIYNATNYFRVESTNPRIEINESDAVADMGNWAFEAQGDDFFIYEELDNGSTVNPAMEFRGSGIGVPSAVRFYTPVTNKGQSFNISNAVPQGFSVTDNTNDVNAILNANNTDGFVGTVSNHDLEIRTNDTAWLTLETDGTVSSSRSCETNYTRYGTNLCIKNGSAIGNNNLTRDSCTAISTPSADATAIIIRASAFAAANNSAAQRTAFVKFYAGAGCTNQRSATASAYGYEFSAISAGTIIGSDTIIVTIGDTTPYIKLTDDTGNQGSGSYAIVGYYD